MLTFVDSGVLIAAARGTTEVSQAAMAILDDPARTFSSSVFVKLETIPKAAYNKQDAEREYYETFFNAVAAWAEANPALAEEALAEAMRLGLGAQDALHIVAASKTGSHELVTTEKPEKPIHRTKLVAVKTI